MPESEKLDIYQTSLDSGGDVSHLGLLDTMLLDGVHTGVFQERDDRSQAIHLGISLGFGLALDLVCFIGIDSYETICAVCDGDILAFLDILQLLGGNLNIFALIYSLGCALLDLDDLLFSGAVCGMVH